MIAYDAVLDGLPERIQETALRLRDLLLSLGSGITEVVRPHHLEYAAARPLARLQPDERGVTLRLLVAVEAPTDDDRGRFSRAGKDVVVRLGGASDLDDELRRLLRAAFAAAQVRAASTENDRPLSGPAARMAEAVENVSRGLRLWVHQLQVMQKAAEQRAVQESRAGQKRSHKKKPPARAPQLQVADAPLADMRTAHAPAARKAPATAKKPRATAPARAAKKTRKGALAKKKPNARKSRTAAAGKARRGRR